MRILAVDPGLTSGVTYWSNDGIVPEWRAGAIEGWMESIDHVHEQLGLGLDVLVVEEYRTARADSNGVRTMELIGTMRWLAYRHSVPFVLQKPADAMDFATNEKLKALGWYTPGKDHARDSTRHLLLYLARNRHIDLSQLVR